ncbi:MAG TPA: alpha/beta hydrolase [Acidimicrobiales bacterium]|nr:alpha/beta hydrolase [Acidimicrobiales bacterium]
MTVAPAVVWSRVDGTTGPLVVLTHGWGDTSATWDRQVAALHPRARVVTWDLRGHGRSPAPDDPEAYSREVALADLEALVGAGPAVLVGHSFGGQLSIAFAQRHPERVAGMGLIGTGPGYRDPDARAAWNRDVERRAAAEERRGRRALAHAIRGFVAQHDAAVMDALPSITVPTLVLVGAGDRGFLAAADYLHAKIAGSTRVVVPQAGHAVNQHQPGAVSCALLDLLVRCTAPSQGS